MWHSIRSQKALGRRNKIDSRWLERGESEKAPREGWRAEPECVCVCVRVRPVARARVPQVGLRGSRGRPCEWARESIPRTL